MAVVRLPSIHMSSAFPTLNDLQKETIQNDRSHSDHRYLSQHRTVHAGLPSTFSPPRSPQLPTKHAQFMTHEEFGGAYAPSRMPLHHAHATLAESPASSPSSSQRKRRRRDSDMSMAGRASGSSDAASPFGTVQITSTSIRALVHDDNDDYDQSLRRCSVTYDDDHSDWAASSSRGSGRDSDLWESSVGQIDHVDKDSSATAAAAAASTTASTSESRPVITNASRNITFDMLQVHFSKSLKDAANCFGVCTTLLKKICRKNGIVSWPYRQIIGLQKSIASMEQQVHYFDGEQRRQYAEQLRKLHIKLDAYIRTGEAPSDEELAATNPSQPALPSTKYNPQSIMAPVVTLDVVGEPQLQQRPQQQQQQRQQRYETYSWPTASTNSSQNAYDYRQHGVDATQDYAVAAPAQQHSPSRLPSIAYILNQQSPPHSHQVQYQDQYRHHQQPQPHFPREEGYRDW